MLNDSGSLVWLSALYRALVIRCPGAAAEKCGRLVSDIGRKRFSQLQLTLPCNKRTRETSGQADSDDVEYYRRLRWGYLIKQKVNTA